MDASERKMCLLLRFHVSTLQDAGFLSSGSRGNDALAGDGNQFCWLRVRLAKNEKLVKSSGK